MAEHPEITSRKTIALSARLWEAIDEYHHAERIKTEIEAIRRLLEMARAGCRRDGSGNVEPYLARLSAADRGGSSPLCTASIFMMHERD
jgi:hypothetical protein